MSRTETFQTLLDKSESPQQTFILMAQLQMLRQQERKHRDAERQEALMEEAICKLIQGEK